MNRNMRLVLSAVFLLVFGAYISGTILTPYAESLGASYIVIGMLPSSMYLVRLIFGTPIGKFADKKGALKVLKFSLVLFPFIAIAYYFATSIPMLFVARLLHGVASAMLLPMAQAYIGQLSPKGSEGRYMGIYNLIFFVGSGLGAFISTIIASKISFRANFVFLFALALAALVIIIMAKGDEPQSASGAVDNGTCKEPKKIKLSRNVGLLALAVINIPLAVISSMTGFFFIQFPSARGYSLIAAGVILAVYNVLSGAVQVPFGKLSDRTDKFAVILVSGIVTTVALAALPSTHQIIVMLLLMVFVAIGSAALLAATASLSAIVGRDAGMAGTMGFLGTVNSLGMIFGSIFLGLLPGKFGIGSVFYFSAISAIVGTAVFAFLWIRHSRTHTYEEVN